MTEIKTGPSHFDAIQYALDLNYQEASARTFACSDVGEALATRDVQIVTCGYPVAEFNWAFLRLPGGNPEKAAERAERYFDERSLPFRFIVRRELAAGGIADLLESRGHALVAQTVPGMSLIPLPEPPPHPAELDVRRVADEVTLSDFQKTAFTGFGIPSEFGAAFLTSDLLLCPQTELFVSFVDRVPVATAMLMATGPVAGIYWVATIEEHRRKGYGEATTWAALEAGRQLGCQFGSLQASKMGRPVYERMGFKVSVEYLSYARVSDE